MTGRAADGITERLHALAERRLSEEEAEAYLRPPMTREEEAEVLSLIAWFNKRYPTPLARLEYVRRAYRRWTRDAGIGT